MKTMRRLAAVSTATALLLTGCGDDPEPEPEPTAEPTGEPADGDGDATDAEGTDQDGAADDTATDGADDGAEASRLGEVEIDQTQSHTNGVEVTVQALRVEQNAIYVDLEAFNGAGHEILLAALDLAILVDDTGKEYRYEPPEDNQPLSIESGGTLEGSIAFLGRVGPEATTVTLQFNYSREGEPLQPTDAESATLADAPSFEFADLPLPTS